MSPSRASSMRLRAQQLMIELANLLDRLLKLLIIGDRAANLSDPLTTYAELLCAPASICDSQNKHPLRLATCAFWATFGMSDDAL
jgi:hypothetical protein